jgi:ABC-2 type transport system permease protein
MIRWERVLEVVRKEFRQALREPRMRILLFVPPVLQLLLFGYAVNLDVEHARIAWIDQDHTPASRELRAAFEGCGRFVVLPVQDGEQAARRILDRGEADAVLRLLPRFERDLQRGRTPAVQVLIDGADSNTAALVSSYVAQIVAGFSRGAPALDADTRVWFNADLHSRNYYVPGVLVNIIFTVTNMLTALAIVRERELGTMEQLMVTPLRPMELMIGKTLPFAVVGLLDLVLVTTAALAVFHIPFRGNPLLLLLCAILFLFTSLGAGLFVSTISRTQQQAMISAFFFILPAFMLSGFAFPIANMPRLVQYLTYANPLRYFMEIVRGIFLKGAGAAVLWPQMLALLAFGIVVMTLSAARFHKRLD